MYLAVVVLYVLVCLLLLGVVLLQQGKGGDIAAAFGGSSSQTAFGARSGATVLTRATTVLGTLFMLGAFFMGVMTKGGSGSVLSGVSGPAQTSPAVPALPMTKPSGSPATGSGASTPTPSPAVSPAATPPAASATPTPSPARGGGS